MNELTREQIPPRDGKWNQELLWVYRNERGDIIRAQDDHPSVAIKATERITKVSRGEKSNEG